MMSHEIDMSNGRANMAYKGAVPWHSLGTPMGEGDKKGEWRKNSGLGFTILETPITAFHGDDELVCDELNRKVLYRDDTLATLSVVGAGYKVVQPETILSFIYDSAKAMGWQMETAGSLRGGRKIWALCNMQREDDIGHGDRIKAYLLGATSCDYSTTTLFTFTGVRVVCANTLAMATQRSGNVEDRTRIKVYHNSEVDVRAIKKQLGIADTTWSDYVETAKRLAKVKLTDNKAKSILRGVFDREKVIEGKAKRVSMDDYLEHAPSVRKMLDLYSGTGIGSELKTARGTAWGLVNAVTQFYDHESNSKNADKRIDGAWFGFGARRKQDVVDACVELID